MNNALQVTETYCGLCVAKYEEFILDVNCGEHEEHRKRMYQHMQRIKQGRSA